jgi:aryl-alcohol dehydrogenase-like predicted oxidoreductase
MPVSRIRRACATLRAMQTRKFGRTGLDLSVLTFGCGAVGGLMTRGAPGDQERAVARALEAGINHFDTAPSYGDGASEQNLGRVLAALKPDVIVSTKVRLPAERRGIAAMVAASLDTSLKRLKRDHVDLFQLHNVIGARDGQTMSTDEVLSDVVPAFTRAREQGKTRFIGFTAIGETEGLHRLIASGAFDSAQVPYNALNPSAGEAVPAAYPAQDYGRILELAAKHGVGTIGIRVLAGGALSGREERNPLGLAQVEPIGSGASYAADVARARRLEPMLREGHAGSLTEMAVRFAIANEQLSTTEIGLANVGELDAAIAAVEKGPLSDGALMRLKQLQAQFLGEAR